MHNVFTAKCFIMSICLGVYMHSYDSLIQPHSGVKSYSFRWIEAISLFAEDLQHGIAQPRLSLGVSAAWFQVHYCSCLFLSEGAACCQSAFPPSWPTEDYRAACAGHHCLGMAEDGGDPVTPHAFNIHEVRVWILHQPLLLMLPPLLCKTWVHQILSQRHFCSDRPVFSSNVNKRYSKLSALCSSLNPPVVWCRSEI